MFTTRPEIARHLRRRRLDPLDRLRGRHEHPGARRQRLRRRRRHRLHPADRRAASERAGRRGADPAVGARRAAASRRSAARASRPAGATLGALPRARPRPRARHRPCSPRSCPARSAPGCALLRDYGTLQLADVLAPAIDYAGNGYPLVPRIPAAIETVQDFFRQEWPSSAASTCPAATCRSRAGCSAIRRSPRPISACCARPRRRAATARRRSRRRGAAWYRGFVAEAIDRFCRTQEVMDTSGRAPSRPAHRRRHGALAGDDRGAADLRLSRLHRARNAGPGAQGPVFLQQLALLQGLSTSPAWTRSAPTSSTPSSRRRSSPSPTARPGTAIPISSTCRSTTLL